jgi:branched-chain amino acid transport system substrate-binding protein
VNASRLLCFLALLLTTFCGCGMKVDQSLKIGAVLPLTGDSAVYGQRTKKGMDLAVEEINKAGGISARPLEIIYEDDKIEPKEGVSALRKLVSINRVPAVIGCVSSGVVLAMAPVANETKTVILSPYASNYRITDAGDYVFRIYPSDATQGVQDAKLALNLGCKKTAILYINSDYGVGLKDVFTKNFQSSGGSVFLAEGFKEGETDFRAQLTKIKASGVDCIFMPGNAQEMARILIQAKELGVTNRFIATDSFLADTIIKESGAAAEGVIFTTLAENRDDTYRMFARAYQTKFGTEPGLLEALGYDSVKVVSTAIAEGGYTAEGIKNALYRLNDHRGATGKIAIDANGDVIGKAFAVKMVKGGKFIDVSLP